MGVLSRLWLKAPQPQMPFRLLESSMPFLHELQRIRSVTMASGPLSLLAIVRLR